MASITQAVLGCQPEPRKMLHAAASALEAGGFPISTADATRLERAASLIRDRIAAKEVNGKAIDSLSGDALKTWLRQTSPLRRIYPQTLFQWLAIEARVADWDAQGTAASQAAMFHLGQLSGLITGIETPGWVTPSDLKWQVIALANWGARNARSDEAPLLVSPNAVTISTIHSAKGLEFPVVFLADVVARRFPSNNARKAPQLPSRARPPIRSTRHRSLTTLTMTQSGV